MLCAGGGGRLLADAIVVMGTAAAYGACPRAAISCHSWKAIGLLAAGAYSGTGALPGCDSFGDNSFDSSAAGGEAAAPYLAAAATTGCAAAAAALVAA